MRIAVTGASGFIGRGLVPRLEAAGHEVRRLLHRAQGEGGGAPGSALVVGPLETARGLAEALDGIDCLLHLAGRAHLRAEKGTEEVAAQEAANHRASLALGRAALAAGVRRLVFVSTAKVFGERSAGRPFGPEDPPQPADAYARSKWQAEESLRTLAAGTGLELIVLRPPLVYGPEVRGNLRRLLKTLAAGLPLPLGRIGNRRSLIGRDSLVEVLRLAAEQAGLGGALLLPAERPSLSTSEMLQALGEGLGRPARLFPLPGREAISRLLGRGGLADRLFGDFEIAAEDCWRRLAWRPSASPRAGLVALGQAYARAPW